MVYLSEALLYEVNGGDQADYDFGYKIGQAAKTVVNAISDAWNSLVTAIKNL